MPFDTIIEWFSWLSEENILTWFSQYAYQPHLVYSAVVGLMILSSFGLPVPEEVTLVSAGLVAYMGSRPDLYPPPFAGAPTVDVSTMAVICFLAVFLSDFLVFNLGKFLGKRLMARNFMKRYQDRMEQITEWTTKYGIFAAGIFRFTPGLRFPGHFCCGMLGLSVIKFITVDGLAALVSVPTQVLLVAYFGEEILVNFRQFKTILFAAIGIALIVYLGKRWYKKLKPTYR
tara:strand:+ start:144 stop:833 length:690 start_codon:yes stop_codon:yes gene_type:complete